MPTDPLSLRDDAPLLDAWLRFLESAPTPFTIPGHKQRRDLVGDVVTGDVPLYGGLDTMKLSAGVLAEAEARAARLWGADVCRFSTGGATHANQALALAIGGDGGTVIVSRTLHRSLLIGLVLAGLTPVWVRPEMDAATGLPLGVAPDTVRSAIAAHPDARAVFVGDPSYVGTVGDVPGIADAAHAYDLPLIVDAAWAAHFGFHPDLPAHPLRLGADAMVTSAHKTLPAWSQAALVLARTERIDPDRLDAGVEATATTSPAGAILAGLMLVGAAVLAAPAVLVEAGGTPDPGAASISRALAVTVLSVFTPRVATLVMFSTAALARGTRALPRWLIVLTYVVGIVEFVNVTISTPAVYVFPAWIALVSVVLLVRPRPQPGPANAVGG